MLIKSQKPDRALEKRALDRPRHLLFTNLGDAADRQHTVLLFGPPLPPPSSRDSLRSHDNDHNYNTTTVKTTTPRKCYSALTHTRYRSRRVPGVPGGVKRRVFNRGRDTTIPRRPSRSAPPPSRPPAACATALWQPCWTMTSPPSSRQYCAAWRCSVGWSATWVCKATGICFLWSFMICFFLIIFLW